MVGITGGAEATPQDKVAAAGITDDVYAVLADIYGILAIGTGNFLQ